MLGMIHIRSSCVSTEVLIKRVHIYLWRYSYVGRDSYREFTFMYAWIHKRTSHRSMEGFIYREEFI